MNKKYFLFLIFLINFYIIKTDDYNGINYSEYDFNEIEKIYNNNIISFNYCDLIKRDLRSNSDLYSNFEEYKDVCKNFKLIEINLKELIEKINSLKNQNSQITNSNNNLENEILNYKKEINSFFEENLKNLKEFSFYKKLEFEKFLEKNPFALGSILIINKTEYDFRIEFPNYKIAIFNEKLIIPKNNFKINEYPLDVTLLQNSKIPLIFFKNDNFLGGSFKLIPQFNNMNISENDYISRFIGTEFFISFNNQGLNEPGFAYSFPKCISLTRTFPVYFARAITLNLKNYKFSKKKFWLISIIIDKVNLGNEDQMYLKFGDIYLSKNLKIDSELFIKKNIEVVDFKNFGKIQKNEIDWGKSYPNYLNSKLAKSYLNSIFSDLG